MYKDIYTNLYGVCGTCACRDIPRRLSGVVCVCWSNSYHTHWLSCDCMLAGVNVLSNSYHTHWLSCDCMLAGFTVLSNSYHIHWLPWDCMLAELTVLSNSYHIHWLSYDSMLARLTVLLGVRTSIKSINVMVRFVRLFKLVLIQYIRFCFTYDSMTCRWALVRFSRLSIVKLCLWK